MSVQQRGQVATGPCPFCGSVAAGEITRVARRVFVVCGGCRHARLLGDAKDPWLPLVP